MSRVCLITGKKSRFGRKYTLRGIAKKKKGIGLKITGCKNRRFLPNLIRKRLWLADEGRFVSMRLSTAALRTIDKNGIHAVFRKMNCQKKRSALKNIQK